jgi:hypothetical protein
MSFANSEKDYKIDSPLFDCQLVCKDGITLYFCSYILAKYFKVLEATITQKQDKKILFNDFDSQTITEILTWIDTLSDKYVPKNISIAEGMYMFANRYDCKIFNDKLEDYLVENCRGDTLLILSNYKSKKYDTAVKNYIISGKYKTENTKLDFDQKYICSVLDQYYKQIAEIKTQLDGIERKKLSTTSNGCYWYEKDILVYLDKLATLTK